MTVDKENRSTHNKAHHRARQLRAMAGDLRHMPTPRWRWTLIAYALDSLAGLMVAGKRGSPQ